jgi:YVTN family beta-propeller protein
VDLALLPGGQRVLTANHTSDSVSLVDLKEGKVLAELSCGRKPAAVACSRDGKRAAVSDLWSGTVSLLDLEGATVRLKGQATVGAFPRGLAFASDGNSLYAAVGGANEVVQIDWASGKVIQRWPAIREPRHLVVSADGRWLAAASTLTGQVRCWDLRTRQLHWERKIEDGFNLRGLVFTPDGQHLVCAHVVRREFPVSRDNIDKGWVIDSRLTKFALAANALPATWQIALDTHGQAVGDPHGIALGGGDRWLAVAASGTHELLLLETAAIPWNAGDPGDFLDPTLQAGDGKFRRVPLEGRPLVVAFAENSAQAVIANYLLDAVQVVDARAGKLVRSIALGKSSEISRARHGEALFYDARRSHNQWFSCHTCHVDGHTCLLNFDTLNDASYGTPKLTPTLRNVSRTGPWTWHGWQKDLGAAVEKSFTETMFGPRPTRAETEAVLAFLGTLDHPRRPPVGPESEWGAAAQRGQSIFKGKAGCIRCHKEPYYTSDRNYDVKLEPDGSQYMLWNPPSLLGLSERGPYMHDGRAATLDDVLQKHHTPRMVGGLELTGQERKDLLAFLRSL